MQKKRKGFTLVELVIVIAVIAVLSAVLIPTFSNVVNNANVAKDKANLKTLNTQLAIYKAQENAETVDIHAAYTWFTNNGHDLTSKAKGYTYWLDTQTSSVMLCKTDEALSNSTQNANVSPLIAYADEPSNLGAPTSTRANDPGALSPEHPTWVLLDQSENDPICQAINGIRNLVKNAGGQANMSAKFNEYLALLQGDKYDAIRTHLQKFNPETTVYFAEDGFYGCTGSATNYYFDLGITTLNANSANAVTFTANTEIVFPVTLGVLLPGSFNKIGGTNLKLVITNKNMYVLPGALSSEVASLNNIVPTVPDGQQAFKMQTTYNQKEAVYLDSNNVEHTVRVTGDSLGNFSDYNVSGVNFVREYLVPTINFSSVQEGVAMQGIKSVQTYTRVYGNIVSYYGVAYNANGGVLAVSNEVGYVTDVTVGIINNNADPKEKKGNWTIDVSDPERNFKYAGNLTITVTYKVNNGAEQTVTLTKGSGDITDYHSAVIKDEQESGNNILITKIQIKSGETLVFTKTGNIAFNSTVK